MKGVILAGGSGTRLYPLTYATNKHLLPVYNKPVIFYAVQKLVDAGIDRIMIVTAPQFVDDFARLLGSGKDFTSKKTGTQIQIVYGVQNTPSGIAYGLHIARDYVGGDNCLFYLGDNIVEDNLAPYVKSFTDGALVFLKRVRNPERFGVAILDKKGRVAEIVEKPRTRRSNLAVTGVYFYDNTVFEKMKDQPVSERGELEITYINNQYIKEGRLRAVLLKRPWFDVGTFDSLLDASLYVKKRREKR